MFGSTLGYPYVLSPYMCISEEDPARGYLISTVFFTAGIATLIQSTLGVRLPIIQGASSAFMIPALSILNLPQWKCPADEQLAAMDAAERTELWQARMREIQGAILAASIGEVIVGMTGLVGYIVHWITPLTITPVITMIGLSLFPVATREAGQSWPFASL